MKCQRWRTDDMRVKEPCGEASHFPLCTDVWPWPQQHVQPLLGCLANESLNVSLANKVKVARNRLVKVPWNIRLQGHLSMLRLCSSLCSIVAPAIHPTHSHTFLTGTTPESIATSRCEPIKHQLTRTDSPGPVSSRS
jgi:hypothetical protein